MNAIHILCIAILIDIRCVIFFTLRRNQLVHALHKYAQVYVYPVQT